MHFVPGGPVERQIMRMRMAAMTEGGAAGGARVDVELPQEAIDQIRQYYGFDKPVHVRYAQWLWNVVHLDLGNSYIYQDPVWDVIKSRFPISIMLGLTGFLLSYLVCVPLGVLKAVKGFRRLKGHADRPRLVAALRARDQRMGLRVSVENVA